MKEQKETKSTGKRAHRGASMRYEDLTREKYKEVEKWHKEGVTDAVIAERLGITRPTLYKWRREHIEFRAIWDMDGMVEKVEGALLKRALGMTITETSTSPRGEVWTKKKELPPEPTACLQWLRVHSPKWKQAVEIQVNSGPTEEDNPLIGMKRGDLEKLVKMAGDAE